MSPKMPKEYLDLRHRQVLMAAWELFAEKGYRDTTMRDIAKRMEVSTGAIYKYFRGKEEIISELDTLNTHSLEQIFTAMCENGNARTAMNEFWKLVFVDREVAEIRRSAVANIHIWAEAMRRPRFKAIANGQMAASRAQFTPILRTGVNLGEIRSDLDPLALANFHIALALGLQVMVALNDEDLEYRSLFQGIKDVLFNDAWIDH